MLSAQTAYQMDKVILPKQHSDIQFTIVKLHESPVSAYDQLQLARDFYYLRSGASVEHAVAAAQQEFLAKGWKENRFDPKYLTGNLQYRGDELVIIPESIRDFRFWVAEGLLEGHLDTIYANVVPKIRTERIATKKLYDVDLDGHIARMVHEDLVALLTYSEEPCSIYLAPTYAPKFKAASMAGGEKKTNLQIMNYGYIWNQHATFFKDPDNGQWYELLNKEVYTKEQRKRQKTSPLPGVIHPIKAYTFRECDKVDPSRQFFFDGSLQDVFDLLVSQGVKISDGNKRVSENNPETLWMKLRKLVGNSHS